MMFPLAQGGIVISDFDGQELYRIDCGLVQDRPSVYENVLQQRREIAVVAGGVLHFGSFDGDIQQWTGPSPLIAGPIIVPTQLENLLVVADANGLFSAIDSTDGSVRWQQRFNVADVSTFARIPGGQSFVCALDGSRLARLTALPDRLQVEWESPVDLRIGSYPSIAGNSVVVFGNGTATVCDLASGRSTSSRFEFGRLEAIAAQGGMLAIGATQGDQTMVALLNDGQLKWQRSVPSQVGALVINDSRVWVGLANGQLWQLIP